MAIFNDLNDDVLSIIIDFLAKESIRRKPSQPRCNYLTAFASTNRRLRFLATQLATRPLFHSVSIWGGKHRPGLGEKLLLGFRLAIPPAVARTKALRVPYPYALELPLDSSKRCHDEFSRLLTTPARLERLDVHYPDLLVDDLLYPGIDFGKFDLGERKDLTLPCTLDHVKRLSIHMICKALVPFCTKVERIRVMDSPAGEDSWESSEGTGFADLLRDCEKLPHLVDFEINMRIGPKALELIHGALPNLKRLALTGEGLAYLTISDRQQLTARLSLFPHLHGVSLHHTFTSSSRPWGDSPDEPPDYRMQCLLGGPPVRQGLADCARTYFARHAVRFFEDCPALRRLCFLPRSEFRLVRKEPNLAVEWVWRECDEDGECEVEGWSGGFE